MTEKTATAPATSDLPAATPPCPPSNTPSSRRSRIVDPFDDDDICRDPRGSGGPEDLHQRTLEQGRLKQ